MKLNMRAVFQASISALPALLMGGGMWVSQPSAEARPAGGTTAVAHGTVVAGGNGNGVVVAHGTVATTNVRPGFTPATPVANGYRAGYGYGYNTGYNNGYNSSAYYGNNNTAPVTISSNPVSSLPNGYYATLPPDAVSVVVMGQTYFFADGNYYSPMIYGGSTVFVLANP